VTAHRKRDGSHVKTAGADAQLRHVFVRDLVLPASIGIHRHEMDAPQRVCINLDLGVAEGAQDLNDDIHNVVCYEDIVTGVRGLVGAGHINLVETLADNIAGICLDDARVRSVRVRIEKLDVFVDAAGVGVEIERFNSPE